MIDRRPFVAIVDRKPVDWQLVEAISSRGSVVIMRRRGRYWWHEELKEYVGWEPVFWRAVEVDQQC